ncbi:MAG TPA: glycosyltransferase family A protein [Pseudomonadales bacterium]|nr:glycosyltransferase family A protein [Pseudomonadales bacterium]
MNSSPQAVFRIGVVIPSYNRAKVVTQALESVRQQDWAPQQVVVVDDGSSDNTETAIAQWQADHQPPWPLTVLRQQNQGPGAARNRGILALADCDFIAFLDSDDLWPSTHLQAMATFLHQHPEAIACTTPTLEVFEDAEGQRVSECLMSLPLPAELQGPAAHMKSAPSCSSTLVRRDTLLAAGLFDTRLRYAEDKLLFMKVSLFGHWGRVDNDPVIYRNKIKSIISHQLSNRPHQNSRLRYAHLLERDTRNICQHHPRVITTGLNHALWKAWHRAGRHLDKNGHPRLAARYYAHALRYRRVGKSFGRLILACLRSYLS